MPTVSEVFVPPPSDLPSEMVGERSLLIRLLLEDAQACERVAALCKAKRNHVQAAKNTGKAVGLYRAARFLGWRMIGEGDTPADLLLEQTNA